MIAPFVVIRPMNDGAGEPEVAVGPGRDPALRADVP